MVKFKDQGFEAEVPKELEKYLKDSKVTAEVITSADLDRAQELKTATGIVAKQIDAIDKDFTAHLNKLAAANKAAADAKKAEATTTEATKETAQVATSSYFSQTPEELASQQAAEIDETKKQTKAKKVLTKAERDEAAAKREIQRQKELQLQKAANQEISDIDTNFSGIEFAEEVDQILRSELIVGEHIPLFRTFVSNDTKLRPVYEDTIDKALREYDDDFKDEAISKPKGHTVPLAKSKAQYKMSWVESIPPQPKGYFIYVPKWLHFLDPTRLQFRNHRSDIVKAHAAKTPENSKLVIKYIEKAPMLQLLVALETSLKVYSTIISEYAADSPMIYPKRLNSERSADLHALRAVDAQGNATKLSIRYFLPEKTYLTGTTASIDLKDLTHAFFNKSLFTVPTNHSRNKYSKLKPEFQKKFTQDPKDSKWVYTDFQSPMIVPAYDSNKSFPKTVELDLPQVGLNQNKTNITFLTGKADEQGSGYNPAYREALEEVGSEFLVAKNSRSSSRKLANVEDKRAQMQTKFDLFGGMEQVRVSDI